MRRVSEASATSLKFPACCSLSSASRSTSHHSKFSFVLLSTLAVALVCGTTTLFSSALIQHNVVKVGTSKASASATKMATKTTKTPLSALSPKRVFCFGDSLTAGTSPPGYDLHPYAEHLEGALNRLRGDDNAVQVRWRGYPGWTAPALLREGGLSDFLDRAAKAQPEDASGPAIDLVVILAGTNDLGHSHDAQSIFESVKGIHELALAQTGRVAKTMALSIPTSAWQSHTPSAAALAADVNAKLEAWASSANAGGTTRTAFVPFPISEYDKDSGLWSMDGLHFSAEGYRVIGESLAPTVAELLWEAE